MSLDPRTVTVVDDHREYDKDGRLVAANGYQRPVRDGYYGTDIEALIIANRGCHCEQCGAWCSCPQMCRRPRAKG